MLNSVIFVVIVDFNAVGGCRKPTCRRVLQASRGGGSCCLCRTQLGHAQQIILRKIGTIAVIHAVITTARIRGARLVKDLRKLLDGLIRVGDKEKVIPIVTLPFRFGG